MFNFSLYLRCLFHLYQPVKKTEFRISLKRVLVLITFFILFSLQTLVNLFFSLLDEILFPSYRKKQVAAPVFITGSPRSGTTFMHRSLAMDRETFTTFTLAELLFAPTLVQKYIFFFLRDLDRGIGSPIWFLLKKAGKVLTGKYDSIHNYSLSGPDEDEILLTGIFSTVYLLFLFPEMPLVKRYSHFDDELSEKEKEGIMKFYTRQIRKHLYFQCREGRKEAVYLAKSPAMICKMRTLLETFPGCRIIYMERNPMEVIPSWISMNSSVFKMLHSPKTRCPLKQDTIDLLEDWLRQADEKLSLAEPGASVRIPYDRFTRDPEGTITGIYTCFNIPLSPHFRRILENIARDQEEYKSSHEYSFETLGLDESAVENRFLQKEFSESKISSP